MIVRAFDFETTGIPEREDGHAIVEVGWTDVTRGPDGAWRVGYPRAMLVNPGRPIPPEASAVHHLRDADVAGAPPPDKALMALGEGADAYSAHNLDFERQFYSGGGKPMLCTFKGALRLVQDSPDHSLQVLRYHLGFDDLDDFEPTLAMNPHPHRSGPDSYVGAFLTAHLLDLTDFDALVRWSNGPGLLIRCWMRKHRGKLWSEVARDDPSYLDYIVFRSDITDKNIRATAKHWLRRLEADKQATAAQPGPAADGEIKL